MFSVYIYRVFQQKINKSVFCKKKSANFARSQKSTVLLSTSKEGEIFVCINFLIIKKRK